ncbi:MAG: YceI family protein [Bradymonadia bacterium]
MKYILPCFLFLGFVATAHSDEIDTANSSFTWKATKVTGGHEGQIFPSAGNIEVKDGAIQSGNVTMDMKTFTVTDIQGKWAAKLLGHLKSSDFFDVEKFPEATLTFGRIEAGTARGQLTIKGKTNPVIFKVTQTGNAYTGTLTFDRTKFGMIYKSGNFFKDIGDKAIHDEVNLSFKVSLKPSLKQ